MKNHFLLFAFSTVFFAQTTFAQDFKTKSVSIFKNGQSFFIKSGLVEPDDGVYRLKDSDVPAALFGSLWFHAPKAGVDYVKSFPDTVEVKREINAQMLHDLLVINQGKEVQVLLTENRSYKGVLEKVSPTTPNSSQFRPLGNTVTMKTGGKWVSFGTAQIVQIEYLEKPSLVKEYVEKIPGHVVEVGFSDKKAEQQLDMMYLRNGLSWAPEYLLELQSDTEANLTLQAEISNEGEDLNDVDMNLVVGVPNFKFADRLAFLVNFMKNLNRVHNSNPFSQMSNALSSQRIVYGFDADSPSNASTGPEMEGSSNEDFFFYTLDGFSLPKGGRAVQRIFKEEIEIAHIYETNLPPTNAIAIPQQDFSFSPNDQNKVFHTIRVNNGTAQPWTTGSVFIINDQGERRPVSQDMLTYTSANGHSFIKLAESPDVKIKQAEKEVSRIENAKRNQQKTYWYDLVKIEGKIEVHNYKGKKIDLNIRRKIFGELLESSSDWLTQRMVNVNHIINPATNVCWETSIGAGEELEIIYSYNMYVRK